MRLLFDQILIGNHLNHYFTKKIQGLVQLQIYFIMLQSLDDNQQSKCGFGMCGDQLPNLYLYCHRIELEIKK